MIDAEVQKLVDRYDSEAPKEAGARMEWIRVKQRELGYAKENNRRMDEHLASLSADIESAVNDVAFHSAALKDARKRLTSLNRQAKTALN